MRCGNHNQICNEINKNQYLYIAYMLTGWLHESKSLYFLCINVLVQLEGCNWWFVNFKWGQVQHHQLKIIESNLNYLYMTSWDPRGTSQGILKAKDLDFLYWVHVDFCDTPNKFCNIFLLGLQSQGRVKHTQTLYKENPWLYPTNDDHMYLVCIYSRSLMWVQISLYCFLRNTPWL